jgi:hypothetical protein
MKISELRAVLEQLEERCGDLEVISGGRELKAENISVTRDRGLPLHLAGDEPVLLLT